MKIALTATLLFVGIGGFACGGVADGNGTKSNTAIKTNSAGPSTGTAQPNTNAGNTGTNANTSTANSNPSNANNANH